MKKLRDTPSLVREEKRTWASIMAFSCIAAAIVFPIMVYVVDGSQPVSYGDKLWSWALCGAVGIFGIWMALITHALRAKPGEDDIPLTDEDAIWLHKRIQILGAEDDLRAHVQEFGEVRYSNLPALNESIRARAVRSARSAISSSCA